MVAVARHVTLTNEQPSGTQHQYQSNNQVISQTVSSYNGQQLVHQETPTSISIFEDASSFSNLLGTNLTSDGSNDDNNNQHHVINDDNEDDDVGMLTETVYHPTSSVPVESEDTNNALADISLLEMSITNSDSLFAHTAVKPPTSGHDKFEATNMNETAVAKQKTTTTMLSFSSELSKVTGLGREKSSNSCFIESQADNSFSALGIGENTINNSKLRVYFEIIFF